MGKTGHAGEGQPDGVEFRADQVVLIVDIGHIECAMWVAGNEGLARRRPPPRQDPVVALPAAQALEDGGAGSESIKAVECGTAILRAGRNDKGGIGLGAKANLRRPFW